MIGGAFTHYTDMLDHLHEELKRRLLDCPISTFSGRGRISRRGGQAKVKNHDCTAIKRLFLSGHIDILYMHRRRRRLKFAKRRDRIGQHHQRIEILNFLYYE